MGEENGTAPFRCAPSNRFKEPPSQLRTTHGTVSTSLPAQESSRCSAKVPTVKEPPVSFAKAPLSSFGCGTVQSRVKEPPTSSRRGQPAPVASVGASPPFKNMPAKSPPQELQLAYMNGA